MRNNIPNYIYNSYTMTMTKFQYMVLIVAAIFIVLVLIIFGIFVKMSFSQKKIKKKRAPCPDYWEEVKNVSVVDVYPNKEYIYNNSILWLTLKQKYQISYIKKSIL